MPGFELIDAHQHAWDQTRFDYPWLRSRNDLPITALPSRDQQVGVVLIEAGVRGDQVEAEAEWLGELARTHPEVLGVVAALDWQHPDPVTLSRWAKSDTIVGVRIELESASDHNADALADAMRLANGAGLCVDVLCGFDALGLLERALEIAPEIRLVVDHLGGPPRREGFESDEAKRWARSMKLISTYQQTRVKVSGDIAFAAPFQGTRVRDSFVDGVLEAFGSARLMVGSDWPVSSSERTGVRGSQWFDFVAASLGDEWGPAIAGDTAADTYNLRRP
jgi:L-fuconolactonase